MCPNNSYIRSRRRETELVNKFKSDGYIACRSAGSHSAFDVWAFHPALNTAILVQIKTKKGGRHLVIKDTKIYEKARVETFLYSYE